MMLCRTAGVRCLRRVPRLNPSIRNNSTHSHHEGTHQQQDKGYVGDGSVQIVTPGFLKAVGLVGVAYVVYLFDRAYAARNNGQGFLAPDLSHLGIPQIVADALMEEKRQVTMAHYERRQRPIVRLTYPEGANLANPYGLTVENDRTSRIRRAKDSLD